MAAIAALPLTFQVTEAQESDAKEIHEVVNIAFERDAFRKPPRATLEKIRGYFLDGKHTWYVIKVLKNKTTEIACAVLYSTDAASETSKEGNIHMLSARPEYWGKNMSSLLLKKMEERARMDKKAKIRLIVANKNIRLITHYEKHSYRLTNENPFQISSHCI